VIQLGEQLLLLCVERPQRLPQYSGKVCAFGAPDVDGIVGESEAAWQLRNRIAFVGPLRGHVLLLGQPGVGKELVANSLHRLSGRSGALVARNSSTIPDTLIDAELFGNAENYPNAGMRERKGLIGAAHGGTLFLDEFGELSLPMQTHLLRVLDGGEYQRLGDTTVRHSDFRLLAATNRPVSALRQDLLSRFELTVEVPDLAPRREDVPLIVVRLLEEMAAEEPFVRERFLPDDASARISFASIHHLVATPPPGNVRGLKHALWRAIEGTTGHLIDALPPWNSEGASQSDAAPLDALRLQRALEASGGSIEKARRELGLSSRFALMRLMKKHGVTIRKTPTSSG
jgi:DNA-binding NtrC family response regulator